MNEIDSLIFKSPGDLDGGLNLDSVFDKVLSRHPYGKEKVRMPYPRIPGTSTTVCSLLRNRFQFVTIPWCSRTRFPFCLSPCR